MDCKAPPVPLWHKFTSVPSATVREEEEERGGKDFRAHLDIYVSPNFSRVVPRRWWINVCYSRRVEDCGDTVTDMENLYRVYLYHHHHPKKIRLVQGVCTTHPEK